MNKTKKIFALLIALVLVLGMATSVFAASITITHDKSYEENVDTSSDARVYNAYKIFDASYETLEGENTQADKDNFTYTPEDAAVSYSMASNNPWLSVMKNAAQTWFNVDEDANGNYVITPIDGEYEDASAAQDFAAYLTANIPDDATATEVTVDAAATAVEPGYYLIVAKDDKDSSTRVALVTTDVTMVEKNTYIDTGKTVAKTNYKIGDKVLYTATVTIPSDTAITNATTDSALDTDGDGYVDGHGPIILHDKMDSTLTFVGSIKTATVDSTDFTGYTLNTTPTDGCTFELSIPVTTALLGKTVTFTYEAEVNSTAAINSALVNELGGELNGYKTKPDKPAVYTFGFGFEKIFDGSTDDDLTATFVLQDSTGAVIKLAKLDDNTYAVLSTDKTEVEGDLITIKNGQEINIKGLDAGTYKLVEKSTDTGYNLLDAPVVVVITDTTNAGDDGIVQQSEIACTITADGETLSSPYTFDVTNYSGTVLPSTGGIGTTIFYIVGAILVIGAAVVLVTRHRMSNNN